MKFETRRERETRRKRQKQSAILGMVLAFALVMIMGAVIWSGKRTLEKQNKEYQARVAQLQTGLENAESYSMADDALKEGDTVIVTGNVNLAHEASVKVVDR